jgi:WD40 repeat protein
MPKYGMLCGSISLLLLTVGARTDPPAPQKNQPDPRLALRDTFLNVWSARFSHDGKRLALSSDKTAAVWDTATGTRLLTLKDQWMAASVIAFNQDGSRLAIAAYGGSVGVWDARTGRLLRALPQHDKHLGALTFSPRGDCLAVADFDPSLFDGPRERRVNRVQVWDTRTGERRAAFLSRSEPPVEALSFSPDGRWLAAGTGERVTVWEVSSGKVFRTPQAHRGHVTVVSFSPDGHRLAAGGWDGRVVVWELATGSQCLAVERGLRARVSDLAWARGSDRLTWVHVLEPLEPGNGLKVPDREAWAWDMPTGRRRVILATKDLKVVPVWGKQQTRMLLEQLYRQSVVYSIVLSPDGSRLATTHADGSAKVWAAEDLLGR